MLFKVNAYHRCISSNEHPPPQRPEHLTNNAKSISHLKYTLLVITLLNLENMEYLYNTSTITKKATFLCNSMQFDSKKCFNKVNTLTILQETKV